MKNIVIIGAGIAGLYAAKTASSYGSKVTVLEKNESVGSVLKCGEIFTTIYGMPPSKCVAKEINKWIFNFSDFGEQYEDIEVRLPESFAVMTDRSTHEKILYDECVKNGVEFMFGGKVNHEKAMSNYKNSMIIVAAGANSWCRTTASAIVKIIKMPQYEDAIKNTNTAFFKVSKNMNGYGWMFPKWSDEANVGIGYDLSKHKWKSMTMDDVITCDYEVLASGGGKIPINVDYLNPYNYSRDNEIIYVGDAAGLVNPMLAGGAHLAMISGIISGYVSATNNSCSDIIDKYYRAIVDIIAPEMNLGVMVNNMRECFSPDEFYKFFRHAIKYRYKELNDIMLSYIRRNISKHMKVPETSNDELEELI